MLSVLPELWFTKLVKDFEKEFRAIVSAASEYNVTIIPCAFTGKIAGNVYVSCPFIASDRSILGRQLFVWLSKKKIQIWFNIVLSISFILDLGSHCDSQVTFPLCILKWATS